jgi:hypothetical protein
MCFSYFLIYKTIPMLEPSQNQTRTKAVNDAYNRGAAWGE